MDKQFKHKWVLWYHHEKDNWNASGFKQLCKITTSQELWKFYNNWSIIGGITNKHIFLMRENVVPVWEDPSNINGGCWSFKIIEENASELWEDLSVALVCHELAQDTDDIVGLSLCLKKIIMLLLRFGINHLIIIV